MHISLLCYTLLRWSVLPSLGSVSLLRQVEPKQRRAKGSLYHLHLGNPENRSGTKIYNSAWILTSRILGILVQCVVSLHVLYHAPQLITSRPFQEPLCHPSARGPCHHLWAWPGASSAPCLAPLARATMSDLFTSLRSFNTFFFQKEQPSKVQCWKKWPQP